MYNLVTEDMQSKDNYFIRENEFISDLPKDIVNLFICGYGNLFYRVKFTHVFSRLNSITIYNHGFANVYEFVIDGLENLESVKIGEGCFRVDWKERDNGICRIVNCPNLRQLEINSTSFESFKSFELSNLNSIQFINFGDSCFWFADLSLKGE